jgi:hypothetical protein
MGTHAKRTKRVVLLRALSLLPLDRFSSAPLSLTDSSAGVRLCFLNIVNDMLATGRGSSQNNLLYSLPLSFSLDVYVFAQESYGSPIRGDRLVAARVLVWQPISVVAPNDRTVQTEDASRECGGGGFWGDERGTMLRWV